MQLSTMANTLQGFDSSDLSFDAQVSPIKKMVMPRHFDFGSMTFSLLQLFQLFFSQRTPLRLSPVLEHIARDYQVRLG